MLGLRSTVNVERDLFLGSLRAAGNPDEVVRLQSQQPAQLLLLGVIPVAFDAVELDRPGYVNTLSCRTQRPVVIRVFFGLRGNQVETSEQGLHQPFQMSVATGATRTHAAIG